MYDFFTISSKSTLLSNSTIHLFYIYWNFMGHCSVSSSQVVNYSLNMTSAIKNSSNKTWSRCSRSGRTKVEAESSWQDLSFVVLDTIAKELSYAVFCRLLVDAQVRLLTCHHLKNLPRSPVTNPEIWWPLQFPSLLLRNQAGPSLRKAYR